jgi:hypothetical protein
MSHHPMGDTFHLLFHVYETGEPGTTCTNSTVSAHLFSKDGYEWHTTPNQPYGTTVSLIDGSNFTVATRERPKFVFDPVTGQPTHLINGVSALPSCWDTNLDRDGQIGMQLKSAASRYARSYAHRGSTHPSTFPQAPVGWQRFLGHCMSEKHCTVGCNCASNGYILNFSKCGLGVYPKNCFREAEAACSADQQCTSFALSRYEGGSFETYSGLLNDSAVPNGDWTAYAKRCDLPASQCRPPAPPAPPHCGAYAPLPVSCTCRVMPGCACACRADCSMEKAWGLRRAGLRELQIPWHHLYTCSPARCVTRSVITDNGKAFPI